MLKDGWEDKPPPGCDADVNRGDGLMQCWHEALRG